ncbi:SLC13 family permease [Anaerotignum sp.]
MDQSTIAIIITIVVMILYATELFPLAVTSMMAMTAMVLTGIIDWTQAFSGFSSSIVMMLIGVCIIGESFFTTGLAESMGNCLKKFSCLKEKYFSTILYTVACGMSAFLNASAVMAILMPVVDTLVYATKGKISRKHNYLPMGIGSIFGANLSIIGSTSMYMAHVLLKESDGAGMSFFEPALSGVAACVVGFIICITFGYKLQEKRFTFQEHLPDVMTMTEHEDQEALSEKQIMYKPWKKVFSALTMVACVIAFVAGCDIGGVAIVGAIAVVATRCISEKRAYRGVSWETVFITAASMGYANGVVESGAGEAIANFVIGISGPIGETPLGMCLLILVLSTILSNFMSNIGVVVLLVPICINLAATMGVAATPFVVACAIGTNLSVSTPVCVGPITVTTIAGYRFKDYFFVGGVYNLLATIVTGISLWLVYY